jgi:hypothetical protein
MGDGCPSVRQLVKAKAPTLPKRNDGAFETQDNATLAALLRNEDVSLGNKHFSVA